MDFGKVEYIFYEAGGNGIAPVRRLRLTLIGHDDDMSLRAEGLAELRRKRILRLCSEAEDQGSLLGYKDLCGLLLTSLATIKRDICVIERRGYTVPLRKKRKNGSSGGQTS